MIRVPAFNPIEYLVNRKFPGFRRLEAPMTLSGISQGGLSSSEREKMYREIEEYRNSLETKDPDELNALVEAEKNKEKEVAECVARLEEDRRFFNRPNAFADFTHWSKAAYWTLDEAVALSCGRAPDVVKWENVKSYVRISTFAQQYERILDLVTRAKNWQQLTDRVLPREFLAWARGSDIDVPSELIEAVEARGIPIADWQDLYEKTKSAHDGVVKERDDLTERYQSIIDENERLNKRIEELESEAAAWQFDDDAANYPSELDIAMQAWRAVSNKRDPAISVKQQLLAWLRKNYPEITDEARERIATVCNWGKRGGRPQASIN